jgi:hypothetical protein
MFKNQAVVALLLGSSNAISIRQMQHSSFDMQEMSQVTSRCYNRVGNEIDCSKRTEDGMELVMMNPDQLAQLQKDQTPETNTCTNANKATGIDQECTTPGNSAWNTHTTARSGDPVQAQAPPYPDHTLHAQVGSKQVPETNTCTNANKATGTDQECTTAGNSAWNTYTTARALYKYQPFGGPYPDHADHVQVESDEKQVPETNTCTNANKATGTDQECTTAGNSAWNTYTTARALYKYQPFGGPYPDHAEHVQVEA